MFDAYHLHFYSLYSNCLRSWLEQDTSCPTCRKSLQDEKPEVQPRNTQATGQLQQVGQQQILDNPAGVQQAPLLQQQPRVGVQRSLFHFDGSRYISWLPSFSLQVTNGGNILPSLLRSRRAVLEPERLNEMTLQVATLFPHLTAEQIQQDLRRTHSVEGTIENILEDRLLIHQIRRNPSSFLNEANELLDRSGGGGTNTNTDQDSDLDLDDDEDDDDSSTDEEENINNNEANRNDTNATNNNNNNAPMNNNTINGAVNNNSTNNLVESLTSTVRQRNSLFS